MMKFLRVNVLIAILLLASSLVKAQTLFNPEEKAFLYHVVMKSKVLERNLSDFVHFKGDSVVFGDKVNYNEIEEKIILEPSLLEINVDGFANASPGLVSELSTKMALYALHQQLMLKDEDKPEGFSDKIFEDFMASLAKELPSNATRIKNNEPEILPKLKGMLDPTFSMMEKILFIRNAGGFSMEDQKKILDAYHVSIDKYVAEKSFKYFQILGGKRDTYENVLLAAGDGSGTAGLLGEREAKTEDRKARPKGIGLFNYQTYLETNEKNFDQIEVSKEPDLLFNLIGDGKTTNMHLSLWGFNSKHQATVVVKKLGKSYLFYANKETKELSPDSTYADGKTYHVLIRDVERKIKELEEGLFGKKGFEYWRKYYFDALEDTKMKIVLCEGDLNELRYGSLKGSKKYKKKQNELTNLYAAKATYAKKLKEAEYNLKEGHNMYKVYQGRLARMKTNIGHDISTFEKIGDVYLFEDGSVFDSRTQDLKFSDTQTKEELSVQLLAIGSKFSNENVDEVQLHINLTPTKMIVSFYEKFSLKIKDGFPSNKFVIDTFKFNDFEKFQMQKIALVMAAEETTVFPSVNGYGVGMKSDQGVVASDQGEVKEYPGASFADKERIKKSRMFADLRLSELNIYAKDTSLYIEIQSFTDPIKTSMAKRKEPLKSHFKGTEVTGNEALSALRSLFLFDNLLKELTIQAKKALSGEDLARCNERLKKMRTQVDANINNKMKLGLGDYQIFKTALEK